MRHLLKYYSTGIPLTNKSCVTSHFRITELTCRWNSSGRCRRCNRNRSLAVQCEGRGLCSFATGYLSVLKKDGEIGANSMFLGSAAPKIFVRTYRRASFYENVSCLCHRNALMTTAALWNSCNQRWHRLYQRQFCSLQSSMLRSSQKTRW